VDTVLGVSMAPTAVRMVLVEGENADGVTVDEDGFDVNGADAPTVSAADHVVSAILGTQEGAAESGYELRSTGVTWTDPVEAAALRDALAARKVENVMLVSSFLAAAALAQVVGNSVGYAQTGLLFVEPDTATLAVVNTADGSITEVHRQPLTPGGDSVAELAALASGAEALETRPDGLFLVGSGVDIAPLKSRLEAATTLIVSAPEEPETALARGAALASANAPLFSSSTAALAYAQDPGTGMINPYAVAPGYFDVVDGASGEQALAYSAVADEGADAYTALADEGDFETGTYTGVGAVPLEGGRRPFFLVTSAVVAILVVGAAALLVALAISMRPTAAVRPEPGHNAVAPKPAPAAPAAPAPASAPAPAAPAPAPEAPAPEPAAPAPAPEPAAPAPAPVAPAPEPVPAAPVPAPVPVAPAPAPVAPAPAPAPVAPVPVPVPIPLPILGGSGPPLGPWGGDHGGGGWGHGGGYPGGGGGGYPGGGGGYPGGGFGGGHGGFGGGHGGFGHGGFGRGGFGF
jgi:hypothetical protein